MRKALVAGVLALSALSLTACGNPYGNDREVTITVTDKDRVCSGNSEGGSDCQYLVFTEDETYKNVDSLLNKKFNSSDVQGKLKVGGTYVVEVEGYRSGILSEYPNIIRVKEAK